MPPTAPAVDPWLRRRGMPGLLGKNVPVTGGTSGIGQATAVRFAEHGANVAINYLTTPEEAAGTEEQVHTCLRKVRQHGVRDVLVQGDVASEADVVRMVREAAERLGGLDILINNAGIQVSRPSEQLASAEFDRVLAVDLRGSFLCAREAIKRFLADEKPGVVINVSSVHEIDPQAELSRATASARAGSGNMTRTLALEYARRGIRVNAVGPGATITPINRAWTDDPRQDGDRLKPHPTGPPRHRGRHGRGVRVPGLRRRRLHHGTDDLHRRRPAPCTPTSASRGRPSERRGHRAGGRRRSAPRTSSECSTTSPTPPARQALRLVRSGTSVRPWARARASSRRCFRGATSARRWSPPPITATAAAWARTGSTGSPSIAGTAAARHPPGRAQPPADRRSRLQRLERLRASRTPRAFGDSASRRCPRS